MPRLSTLYARLKALEAQALKLQESAPRLPTGWIPPKQTGLSKPCPRCGREQPRGQSKDDLRRYAALNPTAVYYTRADGEVRAHDVGCDLLPGGQTLPRQQPFALHHPNRVNPVWTQARRSR